MKNLKKVLALGLSAAMALSMFVTGAGAAFTDEADIKATDAVNMLTSLGVIEGNPDGSFKPDATVTRAEMAKMIFVVRNNKVDDSAYKNISTKFTDIQGHWAAGYIKFCESQGIIAGKTATSFAPDETVTGTEAAKMLLVLTGYEPTKAGLTGPMWATNTLKYAAEAGILDDVDSPLESGLPRQYAAQEIANCLDAWRITWSTDAEAFDYFTTGGIKEKVGKKYMGLYSSVGTLVTISKDSMALDASTIDAAESDTVSASHVSAFTKVKTDYSNLLGQKVKVLFKDGKSNNVLGVYPLSDNAVYSTIMNGVEEDDGKIKFGGKSYSVEGIKVYVDGSHLVKTSGGTETFGATSFDDSASLFDGSRYIGTTAYTRNVANNVSADEVKFVDSDGNGKIDTAIVTTVGYAKATYISSSEIYAGETYKAEDHNIAEDIEKNDYVAIRANLFEDCKDITKLEKMTGVKVTGKKTGPTKWLIDGTWYVEGTGANMNSIQTGNTVDAYTVNGVVVYAKRTSGDNASISDVAMVVATGNDIEGDKVKLAYFGGKTEIVTIDTDAKTADGYVEKGNLEIGAVYEYETKSNEYRFKLLDPATDYYGGDYTAIGNGEYAAGKNISGTANNDKYYGATKIDDSAKVFVIKGYDAAGFDYKAITGKQLKTLGVTGSGNDILASNALVTGFTSKVDGVKRITYAVVQVNNIGSSFQTNDNYAYITATAYEAGSGYIVYKVWTGTEEVTVQEKKNSISGRSKGTVIGYSSLKTEDGDEYATIEDATNSIGLNSNAVIYGVDSEENPSKISFDGNTQYDITRDTVILFVDTKDHKGIQEGSVTEADDIEGTYIPNAMYAQSGGDVTVLVVDTRNKLGGGAYVIDNAAPTAATINSFLAKGDVEVQGTLPTGVTVPAGKMLTVKTLDNVITVNGTLVLDKNVAYDLSKITGASGAKVKFSSAVATEVSNVGSFKKDASNVLTTSGEVAAGNITGQTYTFDGANFVKA